MHFTRTFCCLLALISPALLGRAGEATNAAVATAAVYVPDYSHVNEPLPDNVFAWDALQKSEELTNDLQVARFSFNFTNVTTNVVAILSVHPSCGCTTAELPPVPWAISPGASGQIKLSVNVQGKSLEDRVSTLLKTVNISTERGQKTLMLTVNILPPPPLPEMTTEQRAAGVAAAQVDRQAVFKGDCASCHLPKIEGKYGQRLFESLCKICHEAKHRATVVPDLHSLTVPTNDEFWRTWITYGKPGSLMPAFATSQGGPLNDLQIASLAAYLNAVIPSHATNAPAK
jgi:mono/diheme cytochrome c family protein